jgi:hypothetical protein
MLFLRGGLFLFFLTFSLVGKAEEDGFLDLSGEVVFATSSVLEDGYEATDGPVVQPYLIFGLGGGCQAEIWNSTGLTEHTGNETEVGVSCSRNWQEATVGFWVIQYFLYAEDDITDVTFFMERGDWYASASHFSWYGGNEDAVRFQLNRIFLVMEKLELRLGVVYQTGYGEPDTLAGTAEVEYHLTDEWSVSLFTMTKKNNFGEDHPNDEFRDDVVLKLKYSF